MTRTQKIAFAAAAAVVLAIGAVWFFILRDTSPPPLSLDDAVASLTATTAAPTTAAPTTTSPAEGPAPTEPPPTTAPPATEPPPEATGPVDTDGEWSPRSRGVHRRLSDR